jgi:hypothetical protein
MSIRPQDDADRRLVALGRVASGVAASLVVPGVALWTFLLMRSLTVV